MNRWGIPIEMEVAIRARDLNCVYCGVRMVDKVPAGSPRNNQASWEHIVNDASIVTLENIALCCSSCNASKGAKSLEAWLGSEYCKRKSISAESVAEVVQRHLDRA